MNALVQRLSSHWSLVEWLLRIGLGSVAGLVWWVMSLGGKQRLLAWIVEIESSEQENAAERITCGLKALQTEGASGACFDFIGGLDQWRAVQVRITQRCSRVHRSGYPICVFFASAIAAFVVANFESPIGTWSVLFVSVALTSFAWLLLNIFPLAYMAWVNGLPRPAKEKAAEAKKNPASPVTETSPPRQSDDR